MDTGGVLFGGSVPESYAEYLEPVIFRPWAERLIAFVGLIAGQTVLDVAAGTGVVSRAAATLIGPGGRVIASDLSADMLAHVSNNFPPDEAELQILECSAAALELTDCSVDVAICQQGLQFISDRPAAAREIFRVLRPGGMVGVAVWTSSPRVHPFIDYGDALRVNQVPEPFTGAYDSSFLSMTADEVNDLLEAVGFQDTEVRIERLELQWPSVRQAVRGVFGTPYGPLIASLERELRESVLVDLQQRMTGDDGAPAKHVMTSVLARARRP
ncbi:MAG: methyltransferase domain-containing protein [Acidimicrobiales bacterium]